MSSLNKVTLIGNLGKDPEVRFMPNGGAVANITLATSENWKDKQTGEKKEKTEWHRIVMFGKLAEIAGEYLKKGAKIYVEGSLQTRKWTNQQGQDQYTTEIVIQDFGGTMKMLARNLSTLCDGTTRIAVSAVASTFHVSFATFCWFSSSRPTRAWSLPELADDDARSGKSSSVNRIKIELILMFIKTSLYFE